MLDDVEELPGLMEMIALVDAGRDIPCAICGSTGDTFPCITCDKPICGVCGVDIRWCREHAPFEE